MRLQIRQNLWLANCSLLQAALHHISILEENQRWQPIHLVPTAICLRAYFTIKGTTRGFSAAKHVYCPKGEKTALQSLPNGHADYRQMPNFCATRYTKIMRAGALRVKYVAASCAYLVLLHKIGAWVCFDFDNLQCTIVLL